MLDQTSHRTTLHQNNRKTLRRVRKTANPLSLSFCVYFATFEQSCLYVSVLQITLYSFPRHRSTAMMCTSSLCCVHEFTSRCGRGNFMKSNVCRCCCCSATTRPSVWDNFDFATKATKRTAMKFSFEKIPASGNVSKNDKPYDDNRTHSLGVETFTSTTTKDSSGLSKSRTENERDEVSVTRWIREHLVNFISVVAMSVVFPIKCEYSRKILRWLCSMHLRFGEHFLCLRKFFWAHSKFLLKILLDDLLHCHAFKEMM